MDEYDAVITGKLKKVDAVEKDGKKIMLVVLEDAFYSGLYFKDEDVKIEIKRQKHGRNSELR